MTDLSDRHQQALLAKFKYVDTLLSEIEYLSKKKHWVSPFSGYTMDLKPEDIEVVESHIARIRTRMCILLEQKGISIDIHSIGVAKAIKTHLIFADIAMEELQPKYMKGYGELSDVASEELNKIALDIQRLIRKFKIDLATIREATLD